MQQKQSIETLQWIRKKFGYPLGVVFLLPWLLLLFQWLWHGYITLFFALVVLALSTFLFVFLTISFWMSLVEAWYPVEQIAQRLRIKDGQVHFRRPVILTNLPVVQDLADGIDLLQTELNKSKAQLESSEQSKFDELGKASVRFKWVLEQLRPHLKSALGITLALKDGQYQSKIVADELKGNIKSSLEHSLRLLDEYREMSSVRDKLVLYPEPINLRLLIGAVIRSLGSQAEKQGINIALDYADSLQDEFIADRVRVFEIYSVILGYAVRFAQKGEIKIVVQQNQAESGLSEVIFCVQDQGQNFAGMNMEQLLEPFLQPDQFQVAVRSGSGPGLAFAVYKQIVEQMGGQLDVRTLESGINQYQVKLFFDASKGVPLGLEKSRHMVLVVDDNELFLKTITIPLRKMDLDVLCCTEFDQALELAKSENPDLIITDLYLGESEGVDLALRLKSEGYKGPILGMTATNTEENRQRCREARMTELLSKPFRLEEWRPAIKNSLLMN